MDPRIQALLVASPLVLALACGSTGTVDPNLRPLTAEDVSAITAAAKEQLAPEIVASLRSLAASKALADANIDLAGLPEAAEVRDGLGRVLDQIFSASTIERATSTELDYLLREDVCHSDNPSAPCRRMIREHPIRIIATSVNAGEIRLALLIGNTRIKPVVLSVSADHGALDVDLGAVHAAILELREVLGIDLSNIPAEVSGLLHAEVGPHSVELSVTAPVHIAGSIDGRTIGLDLGLSTFSVDFDTGAMRASGEISLGALKLALPLGVFVHHSTCTTTPEGFENCVSTEAPGTLAFGAAGLHARFGTNPGQDTLLLDDFGFGGGPLTVDDDGVRQLSFDLNATAGHTVDLSLKYLRNDLEIALSPMLEAALDLSMDAIAAQASIPAAWVHEALRLRFDGASQPTLRLGSGVSAMSDVIGSIVQGTFVLSSAMSGASLSASPGQCVGLRDGATDSTPVLESLIVYACE
ncbi:MAG: hypothetical protein U1E65_08465 [Myxococcota bacterium]